ncbi:mersacidin/lichenicidin family type 2 lantibiotic [Paenibacillus zanthoxyli]|uniref:mersacidin/lichenicidin family type 2 lantibiotic n=1 Tax=Paenibacillus zanthoxyli TaxID=369399 RepID=UPI001E585650|nr:mersacidin family lantibiotic [Paenibacillus zanthoxyli]
MKNVNSKINNVEYGYILKYSREDEKAMTNVEMVQAWKNPKLRTSGIAAHPAGEALVEVSADELARVHGGLAVQPDSTPTIVITITIVTTVICFPTPVY